MRTAILNNTTIYFNSTDHIREEGFVQGSIVLLRSDVYHSINWKDTNKLRKLVKGLKRIKKPESRKTV